MSSQGHHDGNKFIKVNLAIFVDIHFVNHVIDHFVQLLIVHCIILLFQGQLEIFWCYHSIAIGIKICKNVPQLILAFDVFHFSALYSSLPPHQRQKLAEIYGAIAICVYLLDEHLDFVVSGVLTKGTHDFAQLLKL